MSRFIPQRHLFTVNMQVKKLTRNKNSKIVLHKLICQ